MSQLEEAVARLTQARSKLALSTERLLDIEARLVAAKAAEIERATIERATKISLREFTSNLLDQTHARDHQYRKIRQSAVK
jgi:hypothetical protein